MSRVPFIESSYSDIVALVLEGGPVTDDTICTLLRYPGFTDYFTDIACHPGWRSACIASRGSVDLRSAWWAAAEKRVAEEYLRDFAYNHEGDIALFQQARLLGWSECLQQVGA